MPTELFRFPLQLAGHRWSHPLLLSLSSHPQVAPLSNPLAASCSVSLFHRAPFALALGALLAGGNLRSLIGGFQFLPLLDLRSVAVRTFFCFCLRLERIPKFLGVCCALSRFRSRIPHTPRVCRAI